MVAKNPPTVAAIAAGPRIGSALPKTKRPSGANSAAKPSASRLSTSVNTRSMKSVDMPAPCGGVDAVRGHQRAAGHAIRRTPYRLPVPVGDAEPGPFVVPRHRADPPAVRGAHELRRDHAGRERATVEHTAFGVGAEA